MRVQLGMQHLLRKANLSMKVFSFQYIVKNLSDEAIEEANKSAAANAQKVVF